MSEEVKEQENIEPQEETNTDSLFPTQQEIDALREEEKEVPLETPEEPPVETEQEFNDIEKEAIAQGWVPQDQWKGREGYWVTADKFLEKGKMLDRLSDQGRQLKDLKHQITSFAELTKRQAKLIDEEKAKQLLMLKRDAITQGNIEQAEAYENEYYKHQTEADNFQQSRQEVKPEVQEFLERNGSWFNDETSENSAMQTYAVKKETELMNAYPHWDHGRRLEETERYVKQMFPHRFDRNTNMNNTFVNQNRQRRSEVAVQSDSISRAKNKRTISYNDLPEDAKQIVKKFAQVGVLDKDEYTKQLIETGVIKLSGV